MTNLARIDEHETHVAPVAPHDVSPMALMQMALSNGASLEMVEKLMDLQERNDARRARIAFDQAIAAAKAEIPAITKNRRVFFESKDKSKPNTEYYHEDLAGISAVVDPILGKHGLSYRFRSSQSDGGMLKVTCVVAHRDGHNEETSLQAGRDESGSKNNHQSLASAATYLQRYTLKLALGLAAAHDDDAKTAEVPTTITEEQFRSLRDMIEEAEADEEKFIKFLRVEHLEALPQSQYGTAVAALLKKIKERKAKPDA